MNAAQEPRPKTAMAMQEVPDGKGGVTHKLMPVIASKAGKKKKATPLDPVKSNGPVSDDQLRLFIERIERLEEEKKGISDDIRDVYLESKSQGYDPKIMKLIVKKRKVPPHDRAEMQAIEEIYSTALGMEA